jgi:hypothetical protein
MVLKSHLVVFGEEGKNMKKRVTTSKLQAKVSKAEFIDWLLAIDASLT